MKCNKCLLDKKPGEFYKNLPTKCKECHKKAVRDNRATNVDRYRKYDADRANDPGRLANAVKQTKKWRSDNKKRALAHSAVSRAIKSGAMQRKPCETPGCGRDDSYAHHESYDRPLDVVFYCQPHHKKRHAKMKRLDIVP